MSRKTPVRMCVGCRQMRDKREMIRVLRTQENTFCIDVTGKKNGRGAYICKNRDCLAQAIANHGFERSFKMKIPAETAAGLMKEIGEIAE